MRLGSSWGTGRNPGPRLEQVLLPDTHEFQLAVPERVTVHGYVLSYEIWNRFVRMNTALIDTPLGSIHDRPSVRGFPDLLARSPWLHS